MAFVRISLGAFIVLGFATACSSSSSKAPGEPTDASTSTTDDASDAPAPLGTCGELGMLTGGGGGTCPSGQTCCTVLLPPSSSCVPQGTCTGVSTECAKASDCTGGQVCCAGSADAGAIPADGGMPMIDPSAFNSACQTSCTASQAQYCSVDTDCPSGLTCQVLGGGAGGGLLTLPSFCAPPRPDAGTVVPDSGAVVDSGSSIPDTGTADAPAE